MGGLRAVHVAPPRRAIGSGGAAVRCRPHSPSRASLRSAYSLRAANKGGRRIGMADGFYRGLSPVEITQRMI